MIDVVEYWKELTDEFYLLYELREDLCGSHKPLKPTEETDSASKFSYVQGDNSGLIRDFFYLKLRVAF